MSVHNETIPERVAPRSKAEIINQAGENAIVIETINKQERELSAQIDEVARQLSVALAGVDGTEQLQDQLVKNIRAVASNFLAATGEVLQHGNAHIFINNSFYEVRSVDDNPNLLHNP